MDVVLLSAALYELPPSQRASAIVHEGTTDLGLWRPPGPDRELLHAYGETLPRVLDKERAQLPGGALALGQALRLHPGKLRCDYLIWVAGRLPHAQRDSSPPPSPGIVERLVESALALACEHGSLRVAFGPLGAGPGATDVADRLAAVVRGADAYRTACLQRGSALPIEEVLVCSPSVAEVAKARRATARLAKEPGPVRPLPRVEAPRAARSASTGTARTARARGRRLDSGELSAARARALPYDRNGVYGAGDWFVHPVFGVGKVQEVLGPERMVTVLFEDGEERRLIHARG
ncbi:MAG: hypothetical protein ACHQ53_10510 [Polyangiales bacterium]